MFTKQSTGQQSAKNLGRIQSIFQPGQTTFTTCQTVYALYQTSFAMIAENFGEVATAPII